MRPPNRQSGGPVLGARGGWLVGQQGGHCRADGGPVLTGLPPRLGTDDAYG
jgi:hypothetical protein